jgi:hypothetical protein
MNRRVRRWFEYIERELERYIPVDPFDDMVSMLAEGTAFSFSRFGDGEFNAIFGIEGSNCDHHPYYPELRLRLKQIVESDPEYLMGLQPLAVLYHGALQIWRLAGDRSWVLADALHLASEVGRLGLFLDALAGREVALVGPAHLRPLSEARGWTHVEVPPRNCWTHYEEILEQLEASSAERDEVLLFSASMMSNVLIDDLHGKNPQNTHIDTGSVLDPYVGVSSRGYHRRFGPAALRQIEAYGVRVGA